MTPHWLKRMLSSRVGRFASQLVRRYFVHDVARQGAALAYYLLFTLFPFLIFVSSLPGLLELDLSGVTAALEGILPSGVIVVLRTYLDYISRTSSASMLWFGLVFSVYFPTRAASCLMGAVRRAYHLPRPGNRLRYRLRVLLCTMLLLLAVALTLVLMTTGRRVLAYVGGALHLTEEMIRLWSVLRFALLGAVIFAAVGFLYAAAQDERRPAGDIVPGAVAALLSWMALSAGYAFYVENFSNYSVIYGALGTVVVLLIWLYLTAAVLIMGAEMNGVLLALAGARRNGVGPQGGPV